MMDTKKIFQDERGSSFLENALWIILFILAVAPMIAGVATTTGNKFGAMTDRIGQVGTP